jgi:putative heme iron utilization protein
MAAEDTAGGGAPLTTGDEVRELLRAHGAGVLCTISERLGGSPFGSLASFALTARGEPIFLFSRLAQHTQNVEADPRATLFVYDGLGTRDDPQTGRRTALVGRVERLADGEVADARGRYLARHPQAEPYFDLDFSLYRLAVEHVHFVGGFAQAAWVDVGEVVRDG